MIAMCQIVCLIIVLVPCGLQVDGDIIRTEFLLILPWLGNIRVVFKTTIFCILQMVGIDVGMLYLSPR